MPPATGFVHPSDPVCAKPPVMMRGFGRLPREAALAVHPFRLAIRSTSSEQLHEQGRQTMRELQTKQPVAFISHLSIYRVVGIIRGSPKCLFEEEHMVGVLPDGAFPHHLACDCTWTRVWHDRIDINFKIVQPWLGSQLPEVSVDVAPPTAPERAAQMQTK